MNDPLAGQPVPADRLTDIARLLAAFNDAPDPRVPGQRVAFGTSGHRGTSLQRTFNADHIAAICQAVAEQRRAQGIDGPLFLGRDTHALSVPARDVALAVLAANDVAIVEDEGSAWTPTPVISHAILRANERAGAPRADGLILTPSHNPPEDGGIKYNPPDGGPADTAVTAAIEARANELLETGLAGVRRSGASAPAGRAGLLADYVAQLPRVLDMDAIAASGLRIGVDPLGGSSLDAWRLIAERYRLDIEIVNPDVEPTFPFMTLDWDGRVRMDCSSPHAMAGLIALRERFDIAVGLDPDADRHGIVTRSGGLMNPNHFLAVAVSYLFRNRPGWPARSGVGKTLVSSAMIDRVAADLGRSLIEVPVGFKWFVDGLRDGSIAFAGEESAGATFVQRDGSPWTTDKDGILLCLLAVEVMARSGRDPAELYAGLTERFGSPAYARVDAPATAQQKAVLKALAPEAVQARTLAGEPIRARLTRAPGNDAAIGGLKVVTENGWFAARPSGTENVYKIYAESFRGEAHLQQIQEQAREIVADAFTAADRRNEVEVQS